MFSLPNLQMCIIVTIREGEDMDELLEKQADMIRYLQQHNANLERRLLYLQQTQHHSWLSDMFVVHPVDVLYK